MKYHLIQNKVQIKFRKFKNFIRLFFQNKKILFLNNHQDYSEYIIHQKNKTLNPERIKKWFGEEWGIKYEGFLEIFKRNSKYVWR